jgi:phage replication O-like protein O
MEQTPQLENGYIRIANEIWEALGCYRLSGEEWLILNCVIRKTYGFQKKQDHISLSQFQEYTKLNRPAVARAIKKLVSKKILGSIKKDTSCATLYWFNKLFKEWTPSIKKDTTPKTSINKDKTLVSKKIPDLVSIKIHTKETIKDNITKDKVNHFLGLFKNINPSYERFFSNKTERACMDRLIKKYGEVKVENMILALPGIVSKKYAPQITTPYALEAKLGDLLMFMKKENYGQSKVAVYPGK